MPLFYEVKEVEELEKLVGEKVLLGMPRSKGRRKSEANGSSYHGNDDDEEEEEEEEGYSDGDNEFRELQRNIATARVAPVTMV
jgi:hypothetical protein